MKPTRQRIAEFCENESPFDAGEIKNFGARQMRGVRGREARGKHIVFGTIKRQGRVYTQVVTNCSANTLLLIIRKKVNKNSAVYTDEFKSYDGIIDASYKKHYRVKDGENVGQCIRYKPLNVS